ncbi:MAG: hypothetical protein AAGI68_03890 [Planctomycetota bacterium]
MSTTTREAKPTGAGRLRTVLADPDRLMRVADPRSEMPSVEPVSGDGPAWVGRVGESIEPLRANVKDAARAVLTWLAAVVDHRGERPVDDVLAACLRPGQSIEGVDYAALAALVSAHSGMELTAKRVQTAVRHLRSHQASQTVETPTPVSDRLAELDEHLRERFDELTEDGADGSTTAIEVLTAVRGATGRLTAYDFAEGLDAADRAGRSVAGNTDGLRRRFASAQLDGDADSSERTAQLLRRLLVVLAEHDGTAESDMKLVLCGSALVCRLTGSSSLPGVMARLNVLVAGRGLIEHGDYVTRMEALADQAEALHGDAATRTLLHRLGRGPKADRLPTPRRVASYALNNAATRLIHRRFTGELEGVLGESALARAAAYLDRIKSADSGFALVPSTEAMLRVAEDREAGRLPGGAGSAARSFFEAMGVEKAEDVVEHLLRHESCRGLVEAVRGVAAGVYSCLYEDLIVVR